MKPPLSPDEFARLCPASAADLDRLAAYLDLLRRWQRRINLVGASTLADPWRRHLFDSAQLLPMLPADAGTLADLGSGAGFPGLVLAMLSSARVTLVDSDARKCAFLAEAARVTGTDVRILNRRLESPPPERFDVVTARALAPLPELLGHAHKWLKADGSCLLLKGRTAARELTAAQESWKMRVGTVPSLSDAEGVVLNIQELTPPDVR